MKLTQLKFKQVAKRYATAKELPLSTAQEELATFFGFKSLDAALKALPESSKEHTLGSDGSTKVANKADSPFLWCGLSFNEFRLLAHFLERKAFAENTSDTGLWHQKSKDLFDAVTLALPLMADTHQSSGTLKKAFSIQNIERLYIEARRGVVDGVWPLATAKLARVFEGMPGYDINRLLMAVEQSQHGKEDLAYRCLSIEKIYLDPLRAIEVAGGAERVKLWTGNRSDLGYLLSDFLKVIAGQKRIPTGTEYESFNTSMTLGDQASIYGTPPDADPVALASIDGYLFQSLLDLLRPSGKWRIDHVNGPCYYGVSGFFIEWRKGALDVLEKLSSYPYIQPPKSEDAITEMLGRANLITAASDGSWVHTLRFTETSPEIAVVRLRNPESFIHGQAHPPVSNQRWLVL